MENTTLSNVSNSYMNWCIPLTGSVYLYGYLLPGIALFVFGVTFNPIALYYFATSRNFRRSAYSYYFSAIAVVDLIRLTVWFLFFLLDYKIFKLHFHSFECSTQVFIESVSSSVSAWLTVALTLERCLVIYKPLQTLTDTRGKRALLVILFVVLASCIINSLVLQPEFYLKRVYRERSNMIVCYYEQSSSFNVTINKSNSLLTPNRKRIYLLITVIFRVAVPFVLLLTANIILFLSVRRTRRQTSKSHSTFLIRHGHHRQVTPMIFFSSCILLLTVSPRYLYQFYSNFNRQKPSNCFLIHFAPHLLKTFELFNYAFNVFVSIVSGKHGRHELFNMLFCRSVPTHTIRFNTVTKLVVISGPHSTVSSKCQQKSNNQATKPLLSIANSNNHYHYQ